MRVLELFAGCGGMALGLQRAGFEHAGLVEFDKHAAASLRANFDPALVFEGDVREFDPASAGEVDLVAGGPPCQPFSTLGKKAGAADPRDMFPAAAAVVAKLAPKGFVFENVTGLAGDVASRYFASVRQSLAFPGEENPAESWQARWVRLSKLDFESFGGLKYRVRWKILNAADHGVPQLRRRVFIAGVRADLAGEWQPPVATCSRARLAWEQTVTGEYWRRHGIAPGRPVGGVGSVPRFAGPGGLGLVEPGGQAWRTVRDALAGFDWSSQPRVETNGAKAGRGSKQDAPAMTVVGAGGSWSWLAQAPDGSHYYFPFEQRRVLQAFPPEWQVLGTKAAQDKQVGNAVPPLLAEAVGRSILAALKTLEPEPAKD